MWLKLLHINNKKDNVENKQQLNNFSYFNAIKYRLTQFCILT